MKSTLSMISIKSYWKAKVLMKIQKEIFQ